MAVRKKRDRSGDKPRKVREAEALARAAAGLPPYSRVPVEGLTVAEPDPEVVAESELATMRRVLNQPQVKDRSPKERELRKWLKAKPKEFVGMIAVLERAEAGPKGKAGSQVAEQTPAEDVKAGEIGKLISELLARCGS